MSLLWGRILLLVVYVSCINAKYPDFLDEFEPSSPNNQFYKYCKMESEGNQLPKCFSSDILPTLEKGRRVQANIEREDKGIPPWLNVTLARKGQAFAREYYTPVMSSHLFGLFAFYDDPTQMLIFSGGSTTPGKALYRYFATGQQVTVWYDDPIPFGSPEEKDSPILQSLNQIRNIHKGWQSLAQDKYDKVGFIMDPNFVFNNTLTTVLKNEYFADLENSDIPLNQRMLPLANKKDDPKRVPFNQQNQALTLFAFAGPIVLFPERLGIGAPLEDIWAFNHLWAWIGYILGIEDEFNIALQLDLESQRRVYKSIWENFVIPIQFHMSDQAKEMFEIAAQGNEGVNGMGPNIMLYLFLTRLFKIKAPLSLAALTAEEKLFVEERFEANIPIFKTDAVYRAGLNAFVRSQLAAVGLSLFGNKCISPKVIADSCYFRPPYEVSDDSLDKKLKSILKNQILAKKG